MGSEASIRPFTPRFAGGEELSSNYEPVFVTNRDFLVSPVIGAPSPMLPKRLARMELDAINNKRPFSQQEKLPEVPEVRLSQEEASEELDEEEEIFEEIGTPKEDDQDHHGDKNETPAAGIEQDARSAFDNPSATFYV